MEIDEEFAYGVAPEIMYERIAEIIKEIISNTNKLKEARQIREKLSHLMRVTSSWDDACLYAVDSSYSVPSIEIAGGYIGIIQVADMLVGIRCNTPPDLKAYVEYHPTRDMTAVKARLYEREHLVRGLTRKRDGELFFDIALVDGEILYRGEVDIEYTGSEEEFIISQTVEKTKHALRLAYEIDTPVVGVLKRSYSRDIGVIHGYLDLVVNDRLLMTMILEPGEYYVQGTYGELYEKYRSVLKSKEYTELTDDKKAWIRHRFNWIDHITTRGFNEYRRSVYIVYYKPIIPPGSLAVKLEVYPTRSWSIDKIVAVLASQAGATGFPLALDYVDNLSSITPDIKRLIYDLIKSRISQEDPELAELVTKLMNPQKPL